MTRSEAPRVLSPALTLYALDDEDREALGRLVKSLCSLNGITVAIEIHPVSGGGDNE